MREEEGGSSGGKIQSGQQKKSKFLEEARQLEHKYDIFNLFKFVCVKRFETAVDLSMYT